MSQAQSQSIEAFYFKSKKQKSQLDQIMEFNNKTTQDTQNEEKPQIMQVNSLLQEGKVSFKTVPKVYSIVFVIFHMVYCFVGKFYLLDVLLLFLSLQFILIFLTLFHYHLNSNDVRIKLIHLHVGVLLISIMGVIHIPSSWIDAIFPFFMLVINIFMLKQLLKVLSFEKEVKNQKQQMERDQFDEFQ